MKIFRGHQNQQDDFIISEPEMVNLDDIEEEEEDETPANMEIEEIEDIDLDSDTALDARKRKVNVFSIDLGSKNDD